MAKARVLVVDDEEGVRSSLAGILKDEGYVVEVAESGERCLEMMARTDYQAIFLDVWLPGRDGLDVLTEITGRASPPSVVMISGHGTIETAVRAAKIGAYDFIEKPLSLEKVTLTLRNALRQRRLEEKNRILKEALSRDDDLVGDSPAIRKLREEIALAAPTNGRVLILGENGTGKELVARSIHSRSLRKDEPFIEINCAAIPEELIESELFGHVRGAFTGALENKRGRFELADGGSILLDEIGDMSLRTQAKVLRVLQEQTFEPVGGSASRQVDVRVIAATNQDLEQAIAHGRFREDLYFRLNVIPLKVPPLRDRREDVPALARHFLRQFAAEYGRRRELSEEAMAALTRYDWPGNVRELRNILERMVIMTPDERIRLSDLPAAVRGDRGREAAGWGESLATFGSLREARQAFEKQFILRKLEEAGGNVAKAAKLIGVERSHLYRKIKAYGVKGVT
jgi:two-component system, NtrC family, nitrogen regulation response regulator NtrX